MDLCVLSKVHLPFSALFFHLLTEEETSTFPPQSPSSTTNPTFDPKFGSHEQPPFTTSILANTTLDDDSQNEASMEYKEIPAKHETFSINQETFVTKQIHETMSVVFWSSARLQPPNTS